MTSCLPLLRYTSILIPYVYRNLRVNGGLLDEVRVCLLPPLDDAETEVPNADAFRQRYPQQIQIIKPPLDRALMRKRGYWKHWMIAVWQCWFDLAAQEAVIVRIDDDVLFIEDGTVETLVEAVLFRTEYQIYSANVVNSNTIGFDRKDLLVTQGLLTQQQLTAMWHDGPDECRHSVLGAVEHYTLLTKLTGQDFLGDAGDVASYFANRTIPLERIQTLNTSALKDYHFDIFGLTDCPCKAPSGHRHKNHMTWDCSPKGYSRWTINFFAMLSRDMPKHKGELLNTLNEEPLFTVHLPEAKKLKSAIVGTGLVVHNAFRAQRHCSAFREPWLPYYRRLTDMYTATALGGDDRN